MRTVLVAYATRLGAARVIAESIVDVLTAHGDRVRLACLEDAPEIGGRDVVVLGSGIKAGRFYPEAIEWAEAHADELSRTQVAIFNTCLNAADPTKQDVALAYNDALVEQTGAIASASFAGRYEKAKTSWWEQLLLRVLGQSERDDVDRAAARAWAQTLITADVR